MIATNSRWGDEAHNMSMETVLPPLRLNSPRSSRLFQLEVDCCASKCNTLHIDTLRSVTLNRTSFSRAISPRGMEYRPPEIFMVHSRQRPPGGVYKKSQKLRASPRRLPRPYCLVELIRSSFLPFSLAVIPHPKRPSSSGSSQRATTHANISHLIRSPTPSGTRLRPAA